MIKALELKSISLLIIGLIVGNDCFSQRLDSKSAKVSEFTFESVFGTRKGEPNSMYTLLGTGFFRAPRSNDIDSLITNWIKKHPQAAVIPVSSSEPITTSNPDSKLIYCWIVQGTDTLNLYLVRNGACPGGTMLRPRTNKEEGNSEPRDSEVHILTDKELYNNFIEKVKTAETYARSKRLGIWENWENEE